MARVAQQEMERRKIALLSLIVRTSGSTDGGAQFSRDELRAELSFSETQLRTLINRLRDAGYLAVDPCYLDNGGQAGNVYRITPEGKDYFIATVATLRLAD